MSLYSSQKVAVRPAASSTVTSWMVEIVPLTARVNFKTRLQRGNRIQLPKLMRWQYKLEQDQVLKVSLKATGYFGSSRESFYSRMDKSGRVTVPLLILALLRNSIRENPDLTGAVMDVNVEPAFE